MIFVTVGTHEQQFNRLIEEIDNLKGNGVIQDPVFIQTGYSTYEPRNCEWEKLIPYSEMLKKIKEARIVVTHGGPASFIMPLQEHKIPIVVPRQAKFDEHVNDHQVEFTKFVAQRQGNLIPIYDIKNLKEVLINYDCMVLDMSRELYSNNQCFNQLLSETLKKTLK